MLASIILRGQSPVGPSGTQSPPPGWGPTFSTETRDPRTAWPLGYKKGCLGLQPRWQDQASRREASGQPLWVLNSIPDASRAARGVPASRSASKGLRVRGIALFTPQVVAIVGVGRSSLEMCLPGMPLFQAENNSSPTNSRRGFSSCLSFPKRFSQKELLQGGNPQLCYLSIFESSVAVRGFKQNSVR